MKKSIKLNDEKIRMNALKVIGGTLCLGLAMLVGGYAMGRSEGKTEGRRE